MKPAILALMRPNNFDLLKELYSLNKFDFILTNQELEKKFAENGLSYESFSKYMSSDSIMRTSLAFSKMQPQWEKLLENRNFQNEFTILNKNYFGLIRNDINALFIDQASTSILLIEAFKNLYYQKNLCLVLVWTDVVNQAKTITFIAKKLGVKVLQLMHGAFGTLKVGNYESHIYSDKVAAYGRHRIDYFGIKKGDDRIVLTGDPDKDKFFDGSVSYDKEKLCQELGFDPRSKIVFFGSTWTGPFTIGSFRNIQETTVKEFLKAFRKLQEEDPTLQLAIKLHPTEYGKSDYYIKLADEAGVKNYRIFESQLYELLYICDIYAGFRSSIIINALIFGKPILLIHLYEISDEKFFEGLAVKWIFTPEEIYPGLKTYLYDEDAINEMKKLIPKTVEYFNYKSDGLATKRVIDLVCKMAEETLLAPVKERLIDIKPSQKAADGRIFEFMDFPGKRTLFVNSMKNLNMEDLLGRKADAKLTFIEDAAKDRDSVETDRDSVEIHYLDLKNKSVHTLGLEQNSFDYIIFKNSLETLYDPWSLLRDVHDYVKPGGKVLVEISNIRNIDILSSIISGYFTYSGDGILTLDHIRFFTPAELSIHAVSAGYEIVDASHFFDESLKNAPSVQQGHAYTLQGNNFILNNVPAESVSELHSNRSLLILKKQDLNSAFTSPLRLPKPEDYFENPRTDLIEMMDKAPEAVLEIGCGIGTTCRAIKERYPGCKTIGIDIDKESIQKAADVIDRAIFADIEKEELSSFGIEEESLDYILYGDVLEHLENPWEVLRRHKKYLRQDGKVIASIPNIRHHQILLSLLYGRWTYTPSGILDATHLRFFTLRETKRLFRSAGLHIYDIKGNPDLKPEDLKLPPEYSHFNFDIQDLKLQNVSREEVPEFSIIQFLVKAGKAGERLLSCG